MWSLTRKLVQYWLRSTGTPPGGSIAFTLNLSVFGVLVALIRYKNSPRRLIRNTVRKLKFPKYKTQAEIARQDAERYFLSDPDITKEELQEFFDKYGWKSPPDRWYHYVPWGPVLMIAALAAFIWYYIIFEM